MIVNNFYIVAFIWLPLSLLFVVCGVAMVATAQTESRLSLWMGTLVAASVSGQSGLSALRAFSGVADVHAVLVLIVVANFWAGTMLMLANAVRFELNRRANLGSHGVDEVSSGRAQARPTI